MTNPAVGAGFDGSRLLTRSASSNRHLREEGRGVNRLVRPRATVETSGRIITRSTPPPPFTHGCWAPEKGERLKPKCDLET